MRILFASFVFILIYSGCKNVKMQQDIKKDKEEFDKENATAEGKKPEANMNEQAVPPSQIVGSYLHCACESEPSDVKPEALIGCRLDDANGVRIPTKNMAVGTSVTYSTTAPASDLRVLPKALNNDNRYDAAYLFVGSSKNKALQGALETRIYFKFQNVLSTGQTGAVSGLVKDIRRDANTLPEPRQSDYNQLQSQILVEAPPPSPNATEVPIPQ